MEIPFLASNSPCPPFSLDAPAYIGTYEYVGTTAPRSDLFLKISPSSLPSTIRPYNKEFSKGDIVFAIFTVTIATKPPMLFNPLFFVKIGQDPHPSVVKVQGPVVDNLEDLRKPSSVVWD